MNIDSDGQRFSIHREIVADNFYQRMITSMIREPDFSHLLQIICTTLFLNDIEHRLGTEPAGHWRSNSLVCECCILIIDLNGFVTSASSGSICHQLRVAAFLEAYEPEHCGFNGSADRQEAVVLEKSGLLVFQGVCNLFAFFVGEDDAIKRCVEDVVLSRLSALLSKHDEDKVSRTS